MDRLEQLPERMDRVESQLLHLREEVRDGFSAVRSELRNEMSTQGTTLRDEMRKLGTELRAEIQDLNVVVHKDLVALGVLMHQGFAEQSAQTRLLFEEAVKRVAVLHEAPLAAANERAPGSTRVRKRKARPV